MMRSLLLVVFLLCPFSVFASSNYINKLDTIAKTILCENNIDKEDALRILSVIHNRSKEKTINGYYKTIAKKNQFTCYKLVKQNKIKFKYASLNAIKVAILDMLAGRLLPTTVATHFYNRLLDRPSWRFKLKIVYISNWHVFMV